MKEKPVIGVTMGDPAGIGPEICAKAISMREIHDECRPVLIGDLRLLEGIIEQLGIPPTLRAIKTLEAANRESGVIEVIDLRNVDADRLIVGRVSPEAGRASMEYIEKAVELALGGEINAVATGPINKQAINQAGSSHIGHTEMLAALCGVKDPLTMFWVRGAKIFFLTRHLSLIEAARQVKKEKIVNTVKRIRESLRRLGVKEPVIAVAALNPHASDEGLIGDEEAREIIPAVQELQLEGIRVVGPVPADSIFYKALEGSYDAVLSLYHDQGHIAAKTVDLHGTISVTLELPFVRTSVDHGTAYDIAGRGVANPRSLVEAILVAAKLVKLAENVERVDPGPAHI